MSRATQHLKRDARAWFGVFVVLLMVVAALAAPLIARHDPTDVDLINQLQGPSAEHWMGTDIQGRDVWARLVYGARISLSVGLVSQGIALGLGLLSLTHSWLLLVPSLALLTLGRGADPLDRARIITGPEGAIERRCLRRHWWRARRRWRRHHHR